MEDLRIVRYGADPTCKGFMVFINDGTSRQIEVRRDTLLIVANGTENRYVIKYVILGDGRVIMVENSNISKNAATSICEEDIELLVEIVSMRAGRKRESDTENKTAIDSTSNIPTFVLGMLSGLLANVKACYDVVVTNRIQGDEVDHIMDILTTCINVLKKFPGNEFPE